MNRILFTCVVLSLFADCRPASGQVVANREPLVVAAANDAPSSFGQLPFKPTNPVMATPVVDPLRMMLSNDVQASSVGQQAASGGNQLAPLNWVEIATEPVTTPLHASETESLIPAEPGFASTLRWPTQTARCYLSDANTGCSLCGEANGCHAPHCIHCNQAPGLAGRLSRAKAHHQRTHWGYAEYFDERPLGDSVLTAMSQQIDLGLKDSMILYHYDFFPMDSSRSAELTPRGRAQLMKFIDRMQTTATQIQVQADDESSELNQSRLQHVVDALAMLGAPTPGDLVVLAPLRHEGKANEANRTYENLIQSIISRGRTIQTGESATFGGR